MAIILRTPTHNRNRWFEFEVTPNQRIQIRSIQEDGTPETEEQPANPPDEYTLGEPFNYRLEAIRDLYLWLLSRQDNDEWMVLGSRNERLTGNATLLEGSVETWARPPDNEWYGLTRELRGRFATFIPPILEYMGLAEVEHNNANGNRMRARLRTQLVTTRHP